MGRSPRRARILSDVAHEWSASNPAKLPSAIATETSYLDSHILPAFGSRPVGGISRRDVQTAVNQWSDSLAPRTVRRIFGILNAILNYANECELIVRNPCRGVKLPSRAQARAIAAVRRGTLRPRGRARTGLRNHHLPWSSARPPLGRVRGPASRPHRLHPLDSHGRRADTRGSRGEPTAGPPKSSAGTRTLSMPLVLVEMLAAQFARRGLTGADANAFVLTMPRGGPLVYQNWRIILASGLQAAGTRRPRVPRPSPSDATRLVMAGVDVKTVQARLGHSDPRLALAVYAQATTEADRAAADLLATA